MFRVRRADTALDGLADMWTQAPSAFRAEITKATDQIDQQLERDPVGSSESRPHGRRILFQSPLAIVFRIESDGQTVNVLRVWSIRRGARP
ncbi:MAG: type II toxin-antitoxin system RelE/ParE family toxin [Gemmataceae bacterium]|nr:type II toxin-antitoxin system RelE/ParE family toxin [Gemmataceae bacterium]